MKPDLKNTKSLQSFLSTNMKFERDSQEIYSFAFWSGDESFSSNLEVDNKIYIYNSEEKYRPLRSKTNNKNIHTQHRHEFAQEQALTLFLRK